MDAHVCVCLTNKLKLLSFLHAAGRSVCLTVYVCVCCVSRRLSLAQSFEIRSQNLAFAPRLPISETMFVCNEKQRIRKLPHLEMSYFSEIIAQNVPLEYVSVISLRLQLQDRTPHNSATSHLCYLFSPSLRITHTFSAFWLRSSVVSVLISLISDSESIAFLQD
jgi:hypothetical protein